MANEGTKFRGMSGSSGGPLHLIEGLKPGSHLCCIYETEDEHRAVLTPFLRRGVERGEKVLYIVDARSARVILGYLRDDGLDADSYLESGQLNILSAKDAYIRNGVFDPDEMISLLRAETERAQAQGYPALRVTGEMSWALLELPGSERLIEYEAKLNGFFPGSKCLAICQYDRRRFTPALLLDVLTTHPIAVIGTQVYDNFYYIPPAEFLGCDLPAAEFGHWVENLAERKRIDDALREARDELEKRVEERTAELMVTNERLRREIGERRRTERALKQSEKELRVLSSQLLTAQEKERKLIAGELHDGIGQSLSSIKFGVENALKQMDRETAGAGLDSLRALIPVAQEAIEEVRRIQADLRPSTLDDLGILPTITWFCREFQKIHSGIRIESQIHIREGEVPDSLKLVIYRILQEAMNNVAKHSKADRVRVSLNKSKGTIQMSVEDNGVGFDPDGAHSRKGLGLTSMRERTQLSGGAFALDSGKAKGTVIRASWTLR